MDEESDEDVFDNIVCGIKSIFFDSTIDAVLGEELVNQALYPLKKLFDKVKGV